MNERRQRFAARWSLSVWITTVMGIMVVAVVIVSILWTAPGKPAGLRWLVIMLALTVPMILGITSFFAPRGYLVLPAAIVIRRVGPDVVIPYDQVAEIRRIESREIGRTIRVFGSGGFFGWFGRFHGEHLGPFLAYGSSQDQLVLITRNDGRKIVISPYPADAFLEAVSQARRQLT